MSLDPELLRDVEAGDRLQFELEQGGVLVAEVQESAVFRDPETPEEHARGVEESVFLDSAHVVKNPTSHGWESVILKANRTATGWEDLSVEAWVWEGDYVTYPVAVENVQKLP